MRRLMLIPVPFPFIGRRPWPEGHVPGAAMTLRWQAGGQARWSTCGVVAGLRASTDFVICIIPCRLATQ